MKYPFTKCFNPRRVVNKYTGQIIEVGCGVCKACLVNRARHMTLLCSLEEQDHKFCRFVTLTYANEYIPRMCAEYDAKHDVVRYYSECDRLGERGKLMCVDYSHHVDGHKFYMSHIASKCKLDGCLSYVSVREAQLFMKRLRKNLRKYSNEKIRYYIASEYGPKTFRAHYHLLLYYDTQETAVSITKALRESWKFGRINSSLSRGKTSSYVARYVNSNHYIPPFLGSVQTRPFSLHSQFFASAVYKSAKEKVYQSPVDEFVQLGRVLGGSYVEFLPWRSLAFTFFPKCKRFADKSPHQLLQSYTILREVYKAYEGFKFKSISLISQSILDMCLTYIRNPYYFNTYGLSMQHVVQYFTASLGREAIISSISSLECSQSVVNSISSELYISRHFLMFVCDGRDDYDFLVSRVNMICDYWRKRDMRNLCNMYNEQAEFRRLYPHGLIDWFYYNRNVPNEQLMKEDIYKNFVCDTTIDFIRSMKHKKQNDLNNYFIYG